MNKKIKPKQVDTVHLFGKKVDSVHLIGKVIGIYKKGTKQISKVLFQSSVVNLELDGSEANLGEDVLLETYVDLKQVKSKKPHSGKSKPIGNGRKSPLKRAERFL